MRLMFRHRSGKMLGYVPNFWTLWSQRFEIVGEQQMQEVQLLFVFVHDPRWKGGTVLPPFPLHDLSQACDEAAQMMAAGKGEYCQIC